VEVDRLAVDRDRALVGAVDAREALDQRRLAGAVVAHDRCDLAGACRHRGAAQGGHAAEALDDPVEDERVGGCGHGGHRWYLMRTAEATTTVPTAMGW
jgi:hypothetical protein